MYKIHKRIGLCRAGIYGILIGIQFFDQRLTLWQLGPYKLLLYNSQLMAKFKRPHFLLARHILYLNHIIFLVPNFWAQPSHYANFITFSKMHTTSKFKIFYLVLVKCHFCFPNPAHCC
jgi:hypothetical protein